MNKEKKRWLESKATERRGKWGKERKKGIETDMKRTSARSLVLALLLLLLQYSFKEIRLREEKERRKKDIKKWKTRVEEEKGKMKIKFVALLGIIW